MDRHEVSRRAAQHALLDALRQFCPQPLEELRDGPASPQPSPPGSGKRPKRSPERKARIRAAQQRVQALASETIEDRQVVTVDLDGWVARWGLTGLRDLAPHMMEYWSRRPAAAKRLYFPKVRPIPPTPRLDPALELHDSAQPLLAAPERESLRDFLHRAKDHYQRQAEDARRPRQLRRHAEWFVRAHVQHWSADQISDAAMTSDDGPDVSTIRKAVAEFTKLLSVPHRN